MDALYYDDADIIEIGWPAAGLWPLVCSIVKNHGEWDGSLTKKYWSAKFVGRMASWPDLEAIDKCLAQFITSGLVTDNGDTVQIKNFRTYQPDPTNAERQERYREKTKPPVSNVTGRCETARSVYNVDGTGRDGTLQDGTGDSARARDDNDTLSPVSTRNLDAIKTHLPSQYDCDPIFARETAVKLAHRYPDHDGPGIIRRFGETDAMLRTPTSANHYAAKLSTWFANETTRKASPEPAPQRAPSRLDTLEARISGEKTFNSEDIIQATNEAKRDGMGLARWPHIETAARKLRAKGWISDADYVGRNVRYRELDDMERAPETCAPPENLRSLLTFARAVPEVEE